MQDSTIPTPDKHTIHRRRLAMLALADRYAADPTLAGGAKQVRELVRLRQAVGQ